MIPAPTFVQHRASHPSVNPQGTVALVPLVTAMLEYHNGTVVLRTRPFFASGKAQFCTPQYSTVPGVVSSCVIFVVMKRSRSSDHECTALAPTVNLLLTSYP